MYICLFTNLVHVQYIDLYKVNANLRPQPNIYCINNIRLLTRRFCNFSEAVMIEHCTKAYTLIGQHRSNLSTQEYDLIKPKLYSNFSDLDLNRLPKENRPDSCGGEFE